VHWARKGSNPNTILFILFLHFFQERLRDWEARERRKAKEHEKEKERERLKEEDREREAKRLKEFLEDYDDERDDAKYYK
jgi:RNA-binding protein 25